MISILPVQSYASKHIEAVNKLIIESCGGESQLIEDIVNFIVSSGGKRVRPIFVYLCHNLCGKNDDNEDLVKASAVVELIHTASLLHDDIIDEATKRRGKKTANTIWGNKEVILVGDFLFAKSFQIISSIKNIEIIQILSAACLNLTRGEVMQLSARGEAIGESDYYNIIYSKTAALFEASGKIGAIIANAEAEAVLQMGQVGKNIGMAFQIVDDILDYKPSSKTFGKKNGADFFEGKTTLPVIFARQGSKENSKKIETIFTQKLFTEENFAKTVAIMQSGQVFEKSGNVAKFFVANCTTTLNNFPPCKAREHLFELISFFCERDF